MCAPKFMALHLIVVEASRSKPKNAKLIVALEKKVRKSPKSSGVIVWEP